MQNIKHQNHDLPSENGYLEKEICDVCEYEMMVEDKWEKGI